jgi:2-oxoisovalerate dehydrogenase E2 component (dihydrolipoyl transacylase)
MKIFYLPDLGEGLAEAEIREWYVKEGDEVKVDQPLVSMETAKAVLDVPSPYAGKIVKLHGNANDIIKTGASFITFETDEVTSSEHVQKNAQDKGSVVGKLETSEKKWDDGNVIIGSPIVKSPSIKAMPAARVLANQLKVDLSLVQPTGPRGLITPDDVKQFINQTPHGKELPGQTESLHGVRRAMAQVMTQSHKEVVPVTIVEDVDITDLPPKSDITVRLIKAMAIAAKEEPSLNAWFDGKSLERKLFDEVHIGLAVDTEEGLFVPVIKNVQTHNDQTLRQKIDEYKQSVRQRTVSPKDLQGATITLSNFGMITGRYATPIIVPPAVAILGCGRSREMAIPRQGQIVIGRVMPLSLTFDHRAVTGGEATRFLGSVIKHLLKE